MRHLAVMILLASVVVSPAQAGKEPFGLRGIKGLWWEGSAKYKDIMKWMPAHHFNFLMFCYSSFPGSGMKWRESYAEAEKRDMKEIADYCRNHGIDLCLSINPGIWSDPPLVHAGDSDYNVLYNKIADIHKLGIDWFAICLDDIARKLTPEDEKAFGTLQAAQSHLINRLYFDLKQLDPKIKLIFCPSAYTTEDAERNLDYITYVGKHIHRDVYMFWTGPMVCSVSITEEDADKFARLIGRKPIIWDNYPVNDYCSWYPILGPLRNRGPKLGEHVVGLMSNPLKQEEASKLPLATIGDYLRDPQGYDPDRSMANAVRSYAAKNDRQAVEQLVKLFGDKWLGQPGFAQVSMEKNEASSRLALLQSTKETLKKSPSLARLAPDVEPQMDKEILALTRRVERLKNGPGQTLTGMDFKGGGAEVYGYFQHNEPETNYVYAKGTGRDLMTGEITMKDLPEGNERLQIKGMDDDYQSVCGIEILINGTSVFKGRSGYPNNAWAEKTYDIPHGILKQGANKIEIKNIEPSGTLGMPPWFAICEVKVP